MLAQVDRSVLVVVDMQSTFLAAIHEADRVLGRTEFLVRCARLLDIPIFVTEQYPERMGGTHPRLAELLGEAKTVGKMIFSAYPALRQWLPEFRDQLVLTGIETPICVNQTAQEATAAGIDVIVAEDAVGGRSELMHRNGLERMRAIGCEIAHGDSVVYEWMQTAEHPAFREVLKIVKAMG